MTISATRPDTLTSGRTPPIRPDTPISGREPPHPAPGSITFGPESTTFRPVASRSPGNHHIPAWSPY